MVSLDAWYKNYPSTADYQQIQAIAGSKPIALAEMGKVPTPAFLASQPRWSYFMVWSEQLQNENTNAEIQASYFAAPVLNRGEVTLPAGDSTPTTSRTGAITGIGGACVDVQAAGTADGTIVQMYACATGTAQTWTVNAPTGTGTVVNPSSGKCLDVSAGGTADGSRVQIWTCNGTGAQQWTYSSANGTFRNPQSGKCLDAAGESSANGTRVQIWTCNGQTNQSWTLPAV